MTKPGVRRHLNDHHNPAAKLKEVSQLVAVWRERKSATIQQLRQLPSKLFFIAQCCPRTKFFDNHMLEALGACPAVGVVKLSNKFCKDRNWFHMYMHSTNGVFIIHKDSRFPIHIFCYACSMGPGAICRWSAYHVTFPTNIIREQHPICHLEALNAVAAIKTLKAPIL